MRCYINKCLWLSFALVFSLLTACASSEDFSSTNEPVEGDVPVCFSALSLWLDSDKARADETGNATTFAAGDKMCVFAYYNDSDSPNFMSHQMVSYDGTAWSYAPVKYWPTGTDARLSFYAYSPYGSDLGNGDVEVETGTGQPVLTYENANADIDLVAAKSEDLKCAVASEAAVPLRFSHILAKVKFTFSKTGDYAPVIHAIKYDIPRKGTYTFSNKGSWAIPSDATCTLLRITENGSGEVIDGTNKPIEDFTAYLMPCSVAKFSISVNNVFVDYTPDTAIGFLAGKQYTVNFVLAGSESSDVFITSYALWDSDGNVYSGDLK